MGTHTVGSTVAFSQDTQGKVTDVSDYSISLSDTNDTRVLGPVIFDIRGTKEIALVSTRKSTGASYIVGQFID